MRVWNLCVLLRVLLMGVDNGSLCSLPKPRRTSLRVGRDLNMRVAWNRKYLKMVRGEGEVEEEEGGGRGGEG